MQGESCGVCGGDGRVDNSFGLTGRCPACHGTGRKSEDTGGFHDVTKTKPSHHRQASKAAVVVKQVWPATAGGEQLAVEIRDHAMLSAETKARLVREIIDYEASHGECTQTFVKKVRKQMRPGA